ncbi:hypothetical protein AVEN_145381-1 [Araneus ventricosus]|uniref:Uncharacterized protein n=1 Tax=Araneus ventricosus TaxID=182803 RepID=A0A4Y2TJZ7_ARAVE|nr:hypothetical protein AVEN_167662-1 [Araneus ventricosus]GBO00973.1 hypothetical protein AVEN_145381-1 [Araneus ventricosus]
MFLRGRGGLIVRPRPRRRRVPGSKPDSTEEPPCKRFWCTLNPSGPNTLSLVWYGSLDRWIPSHADLFFNDLADELAKEGSAEPLDNRGLLTYSEIFSKVRADNNRTWRIPPIHDWHQQKHAGAALELKDYRKLQTTITRFISGHTRTLSYVQGQKVFPVCLKCNTHQSFPDYLLSCMELEKRNLFESPALVRDFLWASGLLDLVELRTRTSGIRNNNTTTG